MSAGNEASDAQSQAESQAVAETATDDTNRTASPLKGDGALRDLIARGEALECSFTFADEEGVAGEGTSFFANGQMRMDAVVTQDNSEHMVSYILKDDTMYTWGTSADMGQFAITMPGTMNTELDATSEAEAPVGVDEDVTYDCKSWSVDNSVFAIPADLEFMDMGAIMEQSFEGMDPAQMEAMMEQFGGQAPASN